MKTFKDKNGDDLQVGMSVNVPEPNDSDIHNFEFCGTIEDILDDGLVIVIDGDFDMFQIEHDRLEINNEL